MSDLYEQFRWPSQRLKEITPGSYESWQGTVSDAVIELGHLATHGVDGMSGEGAWDEVAWHPARIVAAVIEATAGDGTQRVDALAELARCTKSLYTGHATSEDIESITEITERYDIGKQDAYLWIDHITLAATSPTLSRNAAIRLQEQSDEELFMIALGNGGFTASILTALEYQKMTDHELPVYPIRFSRRKHHDYIPRITDEEVSHITTESQEKTIVVFDEDTTSGVTIGEAILYLRPTFPDQRLIGLANIDRRAHFGGGNREELQGIWWEKYHDRSRFGE